MTQVIHPTNHAIERFEERILPLISKTNSMRPRGKKIIKERLYRLMKRAKISFEGSKTEKITVYFTPIGSKSSPPIPITLVINPVRRILVTLYPSSNWVHESKNDSTILKLNA
tara:strand:- start:46 stop:384 length:339 start_codon:yes stop_codon:yes gene_type:complete